ncbi:MAG: hypothetical protein NT084_10675 [Bacteroidetes bacterium]|nr:hypothetical protein [Bacteroidota bacterium]
MSKGYFTIYSIGQEFSIDSENINAFGESASPFLLVPINLHLNPLRSNNDKNVPFVVTHLEAYITFEGFKFKTAQTSKPLNVEVTKSHIWNGQLEFQLDENRVAVIEKHRNGDIKFSIWITVHYGVLSTVSVKNMLNMPEEIRYINERGDTHANASIIIQQSQWLKKILPGLGFQSFKLIEMPISSDLIPEEFAQSSKELEEAAKFFKLGDYDKTVAHCRSALDPLYRSIEVLKPLLKGKSEKDWLDDVTLHSFKWFDTIVKQTWRLSSKSHHIPSMDHFDRHDAEIIYLISTALVAYFGKIKLPEK